MSNKLVSDAYFPRSQHILESLEENPWVRYNMFLRKEKGVLCGMLLVENFVRMVNQTLPKEEKIRLWALEDGDVFNEDWATQKKFGKAEPVAHLEGRAQDLIAMETGLLGHLTLSGPATNMAAAVKAADGIPVVDMSARHYCAEMEFNKHLCYAARVGGAAGTSSQPAGSSISIGFARA